MAGDYIPRSDGDFNTWVANYVAPIVASPTSYGLVTADATALSAKLTAWNSAYGALATVEAEKIAATTNKDMTREALVAQVRISTKKIQASSVVTDVLRANIGITIPDHIPTAAATPTSYPVGQIDTSNRLQQTLRWVDSASGAKAKPAGVRGCEIWQKIGGTPPASVADCVFVALDTASPYINEFDGTDGGKVVYYMLRWINTDGVPGPWSPTIEATVGA